MADIGGVFRKMFPFIAAAATAGGPIGIAAAAAVGSALGMDRPPAPDQIENAMTQAQARDPEALFKLQAAEHDFEIQMTKLGFDNVARLEEIAASDRASARAREIAVKDSATTWLSYIVVTVTLLFEGFVFFHGPASGIDGVIVGRVLGTLDAALILVLQYRFGSSAGSARKTETISRIATGP